MARAPGSGKDTEGSKGGLSSCPPFFQPPVDDLRVSPLGIVPKKEKDEYHLIHHLSFPYGDSGKDKILQELCAGRYTPFAAAVRMAKAGGPRALIAKCDIKAAFRLLPVHTDDFKILGFQFERQFYMDKPFLWVAPYLAPFERFSSFLE